MASQVENWYEDGYADELEARRQIVLGFLESLRRQRQAIRWTNNLDAFQPEGMYEYVGDDYWRVLKAFAYFATMADVAEEQSVQQALSEGQEKYWQTKESDKR